MEWAHRPGWCRNRQQQQDSQVVGRRHSRRRRRLWRLEVLDQVGEETPDDRHGGRPAMTRRRWLCVATALIACTTPTDHGGGRRVPVTVALRNASAAATSKPQGPFVSVLDSVDIRITSPDGDTHTGAPLRGYATEVS